LLSENRSVVTPMLQICIITANPVNGVAGAQQQRRPNGRAGSLFLPQLTA
jgi:hypothetical protein